MECPKCGFQQPEEIYCAQCGVHIPRALQLRRRKTLVVLSATALAFVCLLAAAAIWWFEGRSASQKESAGAPEERQSIPRIQPPPPLPEPASRPQKETRPAQPRKAASASKKSEVENQIPVPQTESKASAPGQLPSAQPTESDPEVQLRRWAAQEWVDRGKELGDDPDQEMEMYRKALEVDPGYAPAHYHLAMVYWKKEQRDLALQEFRKFWQKASGEERLNLIIPEEISPEELGPTLVE